VCSVTIHCPPKNRPRILIVDLTVKPIDDISYPLASTNEYSSLNHSGEVMNGLSEYSAFSHDGEVIKGSLSL
jgi:hypothetical protein